MATAPQNNQAALAKPFSLSNKGRKAATKGGFPPTSLPATDAALLPNGRTGFTMCPNWIYDTLLIEESPSVIKVVLFFNRNTTGRTDPKGQRIEFKQATYRYIANRMKMSVRAIGDAMRTALAKGYLVQQRPSTPNGETGFFEGEFYALNWNWPQQPLLTIVKDDNVVHKQPSKGIQPASPATFETPAVTTGIPFSTTAQHDIYSSKSEDTIELDSAVSYFPNTRQGRQKLPGVKRQILPTCINKTGFKNKKIELNLDKTSDRNSANLNSTDNINQPKALTSDLSKLPVIFNSTHKAKLAKTITKRRGSAAIGRLITDLTREFGDNPDLVLPNISRALNLWQTTSLSEGHFLDLLYQARRKTQNCAVISHRRKTAGDSSVSSAGSLANRMPYFFKVLSELLSLTSQNQPGTVQEQPFKEKKVRITAKSSEVQKYKATNLRKAKFHAINKKATPEAAFIEKAVAGNSNKEETALVASNIDEALPLVTPPNDAATSEAVHDLAAIWQAVCEALRGRFQSLQLAETALKMKLTTGVSPNQLVLSAPGLSWLSKSLTNSDLALFRLALRPFLGRSFDLVLA